MENIEFLKRLFTACSDEEGSGYADGLNLSEMYEQAEEVDAAMQHWNEAQDETELARTKQDNMSAAAFELARAYELQGFINGFRLCAQMGRELRRKGGQGLEYDKIMAGDNLDNIVGRLIRCRAVLDTTQMAMGENPLVEAVAGVGDLLESIIQDFQTDIDAAEDYTGEEAQI